MRAWTLSASLLVSLFAFDAFAQTIPTGDFPVAGYQGSFFLRDPNDWFILYPKGRLQVDDYNFLNRGDPPSGVDPNSAGDPRPRNTAFIRRARIETQGTIFRHFDFQIGGEFASTPATGSTGTVADAFIIVDYLSFLKVQAGQFDAPFTLENRTSDKYFDFMERSLAVRAMGIPSNKDQGGMIWGWLPANVAYYSVGLFNGDGQNFKNQDNNLAVMGRAFVAPLAPLRPIERGRHWMQEIWLGGSFWWQYNNNLGGPVTPNNSGAAQNDLAAMTTQGGFTFFNSNYKNTDAMGNAVRSHLVPSRDQVKWAVEANIPINKIGARFELVHQSVGLAQYNDGAARTLANNAASLDGTAWYVELYGWILGDATFLETPGVEPMPRLRRPYKVPEPKWGLMVAAKYEHLGMTVSGLNMGDPAQGNYSVDAFELGVNAWATKHVRLTANYVMNYIDGDSTLVKKNIFWQQPEHELLFRIAIAL